MPDADTVTALLNASPYALTLIAGLVGWYIYNANKKKNGNGSPKSANGTVVLMASQKEIITSLREVREEVREAVEHLASLETDSKAKDADHGARIMNLEKNVERLLDA